MKKTMKKILCSLLVVVLCLTSAPLSGFVGLELPKWKWRASATNELAATGQCGDNVYWSYEAATGKLVISGTGDMDTYLYDGQSPFSYNDNIQKVVVDYGVTNIADFAFSFCKGLITVSISNSVKSIGTAAFDCCENLEEIDIPDSVTTIANGAFKFCYGLTTINIPSSVTTISAEAFSYCTNLSDIAFSDNVSIIGVDAFYGTAYYNDPSNWEDDGLYLGDYFIQPKKDVSGVFKIREGTKKMASISFYCYDNEIETVVLPNSMEVIPELAFASSEISHIVFGENVREIENGAFMYCKNLNIMVPDSVDTIGIGALSGCKNISVDESNKSFVCENGVLFDKDKTMLIQYSSGKSDSSYTVPNSVKYISEGAFLFCENLKSVKIHNNITEINVECFIGCNKLIDIYFEGTKDEWNDMVTGAVQVLINVTIHCSDGNINSENGSDDDLLDYTAEEQAFINQHLNFINGTENFLYDYATNKFRFANTIWNNMDSGTKVAAEFAHDIMEGFVETITFQAFDGLESIENPYDVLLLDFLASGVTQSYYEDTVKDDAFAIAIEIINNVIKMFDYDNSWAEGLDIKKELKSLLETSDYQNNKLYESLNTLFAGKGKIEITAVFEGFECCGKVLDNLGDFVSLVDFFVEMLRFIVAIEAYYNSSEVFKQILKEIAVEMYNVNDHFAEKFNEALDTYTACINYEAITDKIIEKGVDEGLSLVRNLTCDVLSGATYKFIMKAFKVGSDVAGKINAALWAVDVGFSLSNMLTGNDTIVNCRRLLRANYMLDVASYNVVKRFETTLRKNETYGDALLFDNAFSFYRNVQLYAVETYKTYCETSSTKILSFNKEHFKNELEANAVRIELWNKYNCHVYNSATFRNKVDTVVVACPTDVYVYRKSDNKLVACVIDNISKQYSDEVSIICVGEEKALACDSIDDYIVEIVATGNGSMDVEYNRYSDFENLECLMFDNIQIKKNHKYELNCKDKNIKCNDGSTINPGCTNHNMIIVSSGRRPTCTEDGYTSSMKCSTCGLTLEGQTIEARGHDFDGSKCKNCDYNKADDCSCNCHKGGIAGFFFKLILFFQKLFRTNQTCSCGVNHY